ncbi:hypothetical protein GO755_20610 [Spirosoma sp. HMF4905]|uniref:Uncharacterized protein n=1 Tax=Spirosoma arboris TaxID=2682092 RepID=A0A7K1SF67_9BACT|nr:hypothetical protein [Spirosoma arboris]MVM32459.1 hypothetical protein [Spirosoma arboris]
MTEDEELDLKAQHRKDTVDLTTIHAREWDNFRKRHAEYSQKYGVNYADRLLRKERANLEARFNQELADLDENHFQQLMNYEDPPSSDKSYTLPAYLRGPEFVPEPDRQDIGRGGEKTTISSEDQPQRNLFAIPARKLEEKQTPDRQKDDLDQSQDVMSGMIASQQAGKLKDDPTHKKQMSMSQRFMQGLSYTRAAEKTDRTIDKDKDLDRD